jgi:hypothetical protein
MSTVNIDKKIKSIKIIGNKKEDGIKKEQISPEILDRPDRLFGMTYKLKSPLAESAIYITINNIWIGDKMYPFEIFINTKSLQNQQWIITLTRLISAIFRQHATYNNDISFMIREMKSVFDPSGGYLKKNKKIPSLVAEIAEVIEEHLISIGCIEDTKKELLMPEEELEKKINTGTLSMSNALECPSCSNISFIKMDGCMTCLVCGYSHCG